MFAKLASILILCCVAPAVASAEPLSVLYATLLKDQNIVCYERDASTGELTQRGVTAVSAEPGVLCVSPNRSTLFVAYRSTGQVASFRIDPETGNLSPVNVVEGGDDPAYLEVDRTGKFLLTAYYIANKVTVHAIGENGMLSEVPLQTIPTAKNAHGIAIDSKNRMAFVSHTGANRVYQFRFNQENGKLTASNPAFVELSPGDEPRHVAMHPSDKWLYANNEAGDGLNVFEIDGANATLTRIQKTPSIPVDFDPAKNSTARCEITRDGRFVYVANRGHDSIAAFAVDQGNGRLQSLGQFPTEKTPRSFTIAPNSRFLYAAGQASGKIAMYQIQENGKLARRQTYAPGPIPWCVLAFDIE